MMILMTLFCFTHLEIGITLSPANPGGSSVFHVQNLGLKVPSTSTDRVVGSDGAVKLEPGQRESVVGDGDLGCSVME